MATRNEIHIGIAFVLIGLVYALSDRWQTELTVQGVNTRKPHKFDHLFVMWALKQLLQLGLFFLWKSIENDWFGFARFRHGDKHQGENNGRVQVMRQDPIDDAVLIHEDAPDGNDEQLLIPGRVNDNRHQENDNRVLENENRGHEIENRNLINENRGHENQNNQIEAENKDIAARKWKNKIPSKLIYFPPAFFALAHVLLLYFGLKLTYGSSFIMLKGTVAMFTALLSLAFLAQQLSCYVWFGVVVATLGFVVSGINDYIHIPGGGYEKYGIAAGDLLILMAQIMFATKIIYEEKFIRKHSIHPMMFLGCEGIYGSVFAVIFFLVFNFVDAVQYSNLPNGRLEDVVDFGCQFSNSWKVMLTVFGSLISYILYTYLGMFLIRDQGALSRIMIEILIWSVYWAVCLALKWENFFIAQVPGLSVIVIGALIYSHILVLPFASYFDKAENIDNEDQEAIDNLGNPVDYERNEPPQLDENFLHDGDNFRQQDNALFIAEDQQDNALLIAEDQQDNALFIAEDQQDNALLIAEVHQNEADYLRQDDELLIANPHIS